MRVFFDTEFTELGIDPRLISIGLISEDGQRDFYAELSDTYTIDDCGDFARLAVIPKLTGAEVRMSLAELGDHLYAWLTAFGEPITLATDSLAWDWPWIQEIFYDRAWPENVAPTPEIVGQTPEFARAVEAAVMGYRLRRHHALDDAKANRLAWIAVNNQHGEA